MLKYGINLVVPSFITIFASSNKKIKIMNKNEVISKLNKRECEIAEIICDITVVDRVSNTIREHKNESILVPLTGRDEPSNSDQIVKARHWITCSSINNFKKSVFETEEDAYNHGLIPVWYVTDFKSVQPFETDFKKKPLVNDIKRKAEHDFNFGVRFKFSADLIIEGTSIEEIRNKWESLPIFSKEAKECGVEFCETLLIENAETYKDLKDEFY